MFIACDIVFLLRLEIYISILSINKILSCIYNTTTNALSLPLIFGITVFQPCRFGEDIWRLYFICYQITLSSLLCSWSDIFMLIFSAPLSIKPIVMRTLADVSTVKYLSVKNQNSFDINLFIGRFMDHWRMTRLRMRFPDCSILATVVVSPRTPPPPKKLQLMSFHIFHIMLVISSYWHFVCLLSDAMTK